MSPTGAGKWISGIRRIISRIRGWVREICSFFSTAREMFRKIRGKIHSFEELKELFQMEHAQRFVCIGKKNMLHLWKQIRPRKLKGDILFGTGDPCSTGQCLGLLAVLYGWIGSGVAVTPDFEEKKLEGYLKGKGRLRLITSVLIVIRVLWNKDFKRLWKELKQWKEEI